MAMAPAKAAKPPKMKKKESMASKIFTIVLLVALFLIFILPFYYMLISSFKSLLEAISPTPVWWPEEFLWENYQKAWSISKMPKYAMNSVILSVSCSIACIVVSVPCAFALARMEFRGKAVMFAISLSSMMVPAQCVFLPIFIMFSKLGWLNTYWAMILVFTHSGSTILFIRNAFKQVSNEVLEAARLDGASEWRVWYQIVMPNIKPAWLTVMIFTFQAIWNTTGTTQMTQLIYDEKYKMVSSLLSQIVSGGTARAGVGSAFSLLLMLPPVILFILCQSRIIETMSNSGMK
jgi:ABC-type glycerol-3-phosphate transport system permease component